MAAVLVLLFVVGEKAGWLSPGQVGGVVRRLRSSPGAQAAAAVAVVGLLAADLVLPVPSSHVMLAAGTALGVGAGWAASMAGTLASATIGYALCRRFGRSAFDRFVGSDTSARLNSWFGRWGALAVVASRSLPMLAEMAACTAGLAGMAPAPFFMAAAIGSAPVCWLYSWAGARAGEGDPSQGAVAFAIFAPLVAFGVAEYIRRRAGASSPGVPPAERMAR